MGLASRGRMRAKRAELERAPVLYKALLERLEALPGVRAASADDHKIRAEQGRVLQYRQVIRARGECRAVAAVVGRAVTDCRARPAAEAERLIGDAFTRLWAGNAQFL